MANENSVVTINVSLSGGGITRAGFGVDLILSNTGNAWASPELTRSYTSIGAVEDDFAVETPEYGAASALFSQPVRPALILIGKGTLKPTQTKTIGLSAVVDNTLYKVNVYSDGALWTAEYTSGGGTDNDTIIEALTDKLTPSAWASLTGYAVGDRVLHDTGKIYEATIAGTSGGAATPATVTSAVGPFDFRALGSPNLRIAFNAGGNQDFDITAVAAKKLGAAAGFPWTGNFTLKINAGPLQTVTGVGVASVADLVTLINVTTPLFDGFALVNGANADIWSDRLGSGATVEIVSATDSVGASGFTAGTATGSGTVANNAAVTATELAAIIDGPLTNGTATAASGALVLTSTTTGAGGSATVAAASTADVIMGGEFATNVVKTGTAAGAGAGPTGTGTAITDGSVTWTYISTPNFTAAATGAGGSKVVTATGAAAGNWFALEPLNPTDNAAVSNLMALTDTTADPGVATDLDAIYGADQSWYALTLLFKSAAIVATPTTGAAAWAQANGRLLLVSFADTASATDAYSSGTDALHTLTTQAGSYVAGMWHPRDYEWFDAAKDGYFLPLEPGSDNWRLKAYSGVTQVNLTPTQATNLTARRAAFYAVLGSSGVDSGLGQVEDTVYAFIDNRRNIDWYAINLQADLIDVLLVNNRLPHTDAGLRIIATTIKARNSIGIEKGVISPDVAPTVTVPRSTDAGTFNATTRALSGVSTSWLLAGAINSITVTVNITQ